MSDYDDSPQASTDRELTTLMNEAEWTAAQTLISESDISPVPEQNELIESLFSALSHPGRRYILTYLLRSEGYVTMSELVDYVIESTDSSSSGEEFRREVTVNLTHMHLPLLEEEGLLTYNMERQLIQPTEKTTLAAPYLKVALLQRERLDELSHS